MHLDKSGALLTVVIPLFHYLPAIYFFTCFFRGDCKQVFMSMEYAKSSASRACVLYANTLASKLHSDGSIPVSFFSH